MPYYMYNKIDRKTEEKYRARTLATTYKLRQMLKLCSLLVLVLFIQSALNVNS